MSVIWAFLSCWIVLESMKNINRRPKYAVHFSKKLDRRNLLSFEFWPWYVIQDRCWKVNCRILTEITDSTTDRLLNCVSWISKNVLNSLKVATLRTHFTTTLPKNIVNVIYFFWSFDKKIRNTTWMASRKEGIWHPLLAKLAFAAIWQKRDDAQQKLRRSIKHDVWCP